MLPTMYRMTTIIGLQLLFKEVEKVENPFADQNQFLHHANSADVAARHIIFGGGGGAIQILQRARFF
jgi:hypothetical protein